MQCFNHVLDVVVVVDRSETLDMFCDAFACFGWRARAFADPESAWNAIVQRPPHVVIASTTRAELLARIRASSAASRIAVLSVRTDDDDRERQRYADVLSVATIVQRLVEDMAYRQAHWRGW
ncbi:hypothetical protein [Sandaracinus amylolyticus]|uniref:Response regulatory domain-containing protein n=1 Tax=Sandaracinus amylolyticus TaxID=927083 RepID=A0A0F6SE22_9BACT|nr:hypothetical protein [Sandaracinus amylolyticus]AKF04439.1 hypothetical protein DB32_001588 [Sandaracinus amylolyticus]